MQDPTLNALVQQTNNFGRPTPELIIYLIRLFLRDQPKLNKIFGKFEHDDNDIKLAINLAISDWNTTPPMIAHVRLDNFPSMDWLIVCSAMFLLQSVGVLHYRNDLQYSDSGITVNPWSKGPQYMGTAGIWAQSLENKKREFKYSMNIASTFGVVRSPEYLLWDWAGLYTGPQYDNRSGQYTALSGTGAGAPAPTSTLPPLSTAPFNFILASWNTDLANHEYYINFTHNLAVAVDIRITDVDGNDLKNKLKAIRYGNMVVRIAVPIQPDGRLEGSMIAYKI